MIFFSNLSDKSSIKLMIPGIRFRL